MTSSLFAQLESHIVCISFPLRGLHQFRKRFTDKHTRSEARLRVPRVLLLESAVGSSAPRSHEHPQRGVVRNKARSCDSMSRGTKQALWASLSKCTVGLRETMG